MRRHTLLRELPKALPTTSYGKLYEGTRLTAVPNGNNGKDVQWAIRRREAKPTMIGHASVSTTERVWVSYEGLINRSLLKIQSTPI